MSSSLKHLGKTKDSKDVYCCQVNSFIEGDLKYIKEGINRINSNSEKVINEKIKFNENIGYNKIININTLDIQNGNVFFVVRNNNRDYSRIIKNKERTATKTMHIVMFKSRTDRNCYILKYTYVGDYFIPEPWDYNHLNYEKDTVNEYWKNHAFIFDDDMRINFKYEIIQLEYIDQEYPTTKLLRI